MDERRSLGFAFGEKDKKDTEESLNLWQTPVPLVPSRHVSEGNLLNVRKRYVGKAIQ